MTEVLWQLHPTLASDSHHLGCVNRIHLLLHRNATLHWFMLVPETGCTDLTDLPERERNELLGLATGIGGLLKKELGYPRVNVGALGLVVPQLHLHVIGRRPEDPCWPGPVWGRLAPGPGYSTEELRALQRRLPSGPS